MKPEDDRMRLHSMIAELSHVVRYGLYALLPTIQGEHDERDEYERMARNALKQAGCACQPEHPLWSCPACNGSK